MQKLVLPDFYIPTDDILHEGKDLVFCHFAFLLEQRTQVALLAVLRDDVAMCGLPDDIEASKYVRVFEFGQGLDFAI